MRTRDISRQRKVYPTSRTISQKRLMSVQPIKLEVAKLDFDAQTTRTLTFDEVYDQPPNVTVTIGPASDEGNTNVFITAITNRTCTIETAVPFTGTIYIHVLEVGG